VEHHSSEGPFEQARSAMHAVKKLLDAQLSAETRQLPFGFGVVFPDIDFPVESVEWSPELVLDARKLRDQGIEAWLEALLTYWRKKTRIERDAPARTVDAVTGLLRPNFDRIPSLRARADQLHTMMEQLTEEQYERFDLLEQATRVLCEGGAGTGKTFLAAEVARREARRGERVLFTCRSPTLAAFVGSRLDGSGVDVVPFEELEKVDPYQSLVVDEGQDILNLDALARLDSLVVGGLTAGRWRVFYDGNNQSALYGAFDPDAVDVLLSYGAVPARLSMNCRNTNEIVIGTKLTTGADLGVASVGQGPALKRQFFTSPDDETDKLSRHLDELRSDGVDPGDITILSPLPFEQSCAARLPGHILRGLQTVTAAVAARWPIREMTFARIEDFKGMENQFIALVDIAALSSTPRDLSLVYVGMSRARTGLWVAMDAALEQELLELSERHLPLLQGSDAHAHL
jgi:hypothetical protein